MILSEPGPIPQAPVGQFCRHNLSPRGDGNEYQARPGGRPQDTTYPREGTETPSLPIPYPPRMTQLIPARGRKLSFRISAIRSRGHNLSPRGDGNPTLPSSRSWPTDTTYPREGTETVDDFCTPIYEILTQLIPARGRKLDPADGLLRDVGHNLSPRGDGNLPFHDAMTDMMLTQLIPARGRKLLVAGDPALSSLDTTYPREGTETQQRLGAGIHPRTQLIPARGRKPWPPAALSAAGGDTTYPREGTETKLSA